MRRIHFVPVLGSTKGLATTAIIPESIKKKKKKKKGSRGGRGPHQEIAVTVVRSLEWANMMGRCSVKERRLVYEKKKKKKKKKKEEEEEEEIWTSN